MKKFILCFILTVFFSVSAYAQNRTFKSDFESDIGIDDLNAEQIIDLFKPALISIWLNEKDYYSYASDSYIDTTVLNGSGFIFQEDGLIGTNYHVVENIDSLLVKTSDGNFYHADLIYADESSDFAVIKILDGKEKKFPVVTLGNSDEVRAGQEVYAIGSPLGYEYTISSGIIAAVRENEKVTLQDPLTYSSKEKTFEKVLQITAAISPGNSGGALFNKKGEVIGITTYTFIGYGNLNFAVAINGFKKVSDIVESSDFADNQEFKMKKEESLFNSTYNLAYGIKSELQYNWYYTKQKDSMKIVDAYTITMDSLNKVNFTKAENYYQKCLELKPDTFIVYQELLDLYVITDNFQKAEDLYKDIRIRFDSDSLLNLLSSNLASAYSTSKDYSKAIQFYDKMLSEDSTQYFIYYQLAGIYAEMNDYKKAVREYKYLIKKDSAYTDAYIQLGKIYFEKYNKPAAAKKYLQTAYENSLALTGYAPYNSDIHYLMGMIAVKEGEKFNAILAYLELKNTYDYSPNGNERKVELYKAIQEMDE
ncbi:MAG TPA: trypsin-like peptidase domain-containing protein [Ignavibacteria bacterium]|nr:trypsin-like peptidase domain-containing protein [Ignavibacteria bacterium]